jgi:hypothetical protein
MANEDQTQTRTQRTEVIQMKGILKKKNRI